MPGPEVGVISYVQAENQALSSFTVFFNHCISGVYASLASYRSQCLALPLLYPFFSQPIRGWRDWFLPLLCPAPYTKFGLQYPLGSLTMRKLHFYGKWLVGTYTVYRIISNLHEPSFSGNLASFKRPNIILRRI